MKILPILRRPTNPIPLSYNKFLSYSLKLKCEEYDLDSNLRKSPVKSIFGNLNTSSFVGKHQLNQNPSCSLFNNQYKDLNFNINGFDKSNCGPVSSGQKSACELPFTCVSNVNSSNNLEYSDRNDFSPLNYVTRIYDNELYNHEQVIESNCPIKEDSGHIDSQGYHNSTTGDVCNTKTVDTNKENSSHGLICSTTGVSSKHLEDCDIFEGRYSHLKVYRNETVESIVNGGKEVSERINCLIKERALRGLTRECLEILSQVKKIGIQVSTETYNNCILGCMKTRNDKLARYLFLCLRSELLTPDLKTYTLMIKTHVNAGDISSAFSIYRKMEKEGTRADLVVFSSLIDGLVESGRVNSSWRLFNYMRTWRLIEPDEVLFTIMIKSCGLARDAERALNLYQEMLSLNLYPTIKTYTELIKCLSRRREYFHECFQFYNKIKSQEYAVNSEILSHLLESCCTVGNVRRARELLLEGSRMGVKPTLDMYNTYIKTFARHIKLNKLSKSEKINHIRKTWEIAKSILSSCVNGSVHSVEPANSENSDINSEKVANDSRKITRLLNSVILVYESGRYYDYALEVLQCFQRFNAEPDYMTYYILLRMVGPGMKDVGKFFALWNEARSRITPQKTMLFMALDMAILSRSAKKTLEILNEMYNAKVFPTPSLMKRLYESGKRIAQIHVMINNLVTLQRKLTYQDKVNENKMLQTYIDENELNKAVTTFGSTRARLS